MEPTLKVYEAAKIANELYAEAANRLDTGYASYDAAMRVLDEADKALLKRCVEISHVKA